MKRSIITLFVLLGALTACERYDADDHKFGNVVYLDVAQTSPVQLATFSNNRATYDCTLQAALAYPADGDVQVSLEVDPSLVAAYNARYGTAWPMLDAKYYALSTETATIAAGRTVSEVVTLQLKELMGEGEEQTGALPLDETYLVPVRISGATMDVLRGSDVAYYVVKRSSAITSAASLRDNWINFPTLDKAGPQSDLFNNLTAVTYEAIIRVDDFSKHSEISTIMGVENYLLLRIGDAAFPRQQLQFDGTGDAAATPGFGKFPKKDESKLLNAGEWYHVAATYSYATREVCIYVNGKLQSRGTDLGNPASTPFNLAGRAFYDLYLQDPVKYEQYKGWGNFRQFFLGKSYDDTRQLNGDITEVRVWNVARTEQEIWENMYDVDPQTPGLIGYWKFDEGEGNVIHDWTGNGNDGVAEFDLEWPSGIEVPQLNKE